MLSHYQSLLTVVVETYRAMRTKGTAVTIVIFQTWNLCSYLKA